MKIHVIDTETSGLAENDELLSVAIGVWDDGVFDFRYSANFFAQGPVTPEVAKVNGYSVDAWANTRKPPAETIHMNHAVKMSEALADCAIWLGSNPWFDERMLRAAFHRLRVPFPIIGHRKIDTASLAAPLLLAGKIKSTGQAELMRYFGLGEQPHTAEGDCLAAVKIWEALCALYWPSVMRAA